jgi:hypothetical protein
MEDMAAGKNHLRLNLEILKTNTAAVVRIVASFAPLLYRLPVLGS